jgi:Tfp pilus assembly protein PilO
MKNIVQTVVLIILAVVLTLVLNYFLCSDNNDEELQKLKAKMTSQIDSLNQVIKISEDSLAAIRIRSTKIEQTIAKLDSSIKIQKKIIKNLEKRRFVYEGTPDDLHHDLNILYKRSLAEDSSATERQPR